MADSKMQLQVVGAGFGRTGTASMKEALEMLDLGPCYHMKEVLFSTRNDTAKWTALECARQAGDDKQVNAMFDSIFASSDKVYKSTMDFPAATYYKRLVARNPDAKVILTVRDSADVWWQSFHATIGRVPDILTPIEWLGVQLSAWDRRTRKMLQLTFAEHPDTFGGNTNDAAHCKRRYEEWIEEVKAAVPAAQLLVFNVKQGWPPLCKFLGVPVPDAPFPKTNESKEISRGLYIMRATRYLRVAALVGLAAGAVAAARYYHGSSAASGGGGSGTRKA